LYLPAFSLGLPAFLVGVPLRAGPFVPNFYRQKAQKVFTSVPNAVSINPKTSEQSKAG